MEGRHEAEAERIIDDAERRLTDQQFVISRGMVRDLQKKHTYVITSAQNNTPYVAKFLTTLQNYCEAHDARLLIIPQRYKNPTSRVNPMEDQVDRPDYWWPKELHEFMVENEVLLHSSLSLMGHVKVDQTSGDPLTRLHAVTQDRSGIFGHGQVRMESIPTPQNRLPKILHTTGSISQKNYSTTKAGVVAEFLHENGAIVVHKSGKKFHMRHLQWSEEHEDFYDLVWGERWTPSGMEKMGRIPALVLGDEHAPWTSKEVTKATFGREGLVEITRPREIVRHDEADCYSICHYHERDHLTQFVKAKEGITLRWELDQVMDNLNNTTPGDALNVIVSANHNDRLLRWLMEHDPRRGNPINNDVYFKLNAALQETARKTDGGISYSDPLEVWFGLMGRLKVDVSFLARDDPHMVMDIACGFHGDIGAHGSRGSKRGMSKMGVKTIIGHTHAPGIYQGAYQVGIMLPLDFDYMRRAPSAAMHTHCGICPNGKRQLISIIEGEFR